MNNDEIAKRITAAVFAPEFSQQIRAQIMSMISPDLPQAVLDYALASACSAGFLEIVEALLKAGADARDCDSLAVRMAVNYGQADTLELLAQYSEIDDRPECREAAAEALRTGHMRCAEILLEQIELWRDAFRDRGSVTA
ncbi:MAG: ankyrin repeat domain-containing protein [Acidobacteriaceae bacterium]